MDLLERDEALTALTAALECGGRVVLVTGEPGIGKTALVTRFVQEVRGQARVLLGTCDDLSVPRPLGPLHDLAGDVSQDLSRALMSGAGPGEIHDLLLGELTPRAGEPAVLVLEDVHWADDASLDVITVVGRRVASLGTMLVLTFRDGEVSPGHPLRAAIAGLRPEATTYVALEPLSRDAIAALAGGNAVDIDAVHETTGGNAFYVTELLAAGGGARQPAQLPPSVANAVLGRTARLSAAERRLVELVSVVPNRVSTDVLDAAMPDWPAAAEEPERRALIEVGPRHVRFRHELGRHAVRSSIPIAARRRLHTEILDILLAHDADPTELVHHAEAAGADRLVAEYAPIAARRARALGSNREAYEHFRRAADVSGHLPAAEQAALFEELAWATYGVDRIDEAFPPVERAAELYRADGDVRGVGRCHLIRGWLHWHTDAAAAHAAVLEAAELLEPHGESPELASAYSRLSQLAVLSEDVRTGLEMGRRAVDMAERLGDGATRVHALVNLGNAEHMDDPDRVDRSEQAVAVAMAEGHHHEVVRGITQVVYSHLQWVEPAAGLEAAERGIRYGRRHEVHAMLPYLLGMQAWLRIRAGDWAAADDCQRQLEGPAPPTSAYLLEQHVVTERAVRRGDPDAGRRLADLEVALARAGDFMRLTARLDLLVEHALLTDGELPAQDAAELLARAPRTGRLMARMGAAAALAGVEPGPVPSRPAPYAALARRDWRGAADAFGAVGWDYDRAFALSLLDDEDALAESLAIARRLEAEPLVRRVTRRMRALGHAVPKASGPRRTTRENPAGLTARQLEVLALLAAGRSNGEIADELVLSLRTAEHHVAAVLAKIDAATRRDAARRAAELGIVL